MRPHSLIDTISMSFLALNLFLFFEHSGVLALSSHVFQKYQHLADINLLPDGSPWVTEAAPKVRLLFTPQDNGTLNAAAEAARREVIREEYVTMPIDHFGDAPGTFENRFWVSEVDFKAGGPIFIYDVGEANGSAQADFRLRNETSFFKQMVKRYNGMGIVWEHRFYGNSSPYNISLNTPAKNFQYLTAEQALADVATFAWQFKRNSQKSVDLTPAGSPWIFVGGSYPGMRAAFVRKFYPGTIFASLASSAPVQASVDMSFYFDPVWKGLNDVGFGNCTRDIKAAFNGIDEIMDRNNPTEYGALFEKFLGVGSANNTRAGFADALSTIFALYQSYGVDGTVYNLRGFCDYIAHDPATNTTSPAEGWAATKGANFTINRWANWPYFAYVVNDNIYTNCAGPFPEITASLQNSNVSVNKTNMGTNTTKLGTSSINITATGQIENIKCDLQLRAPDPAAISWGWQYCTQWGFFQSVNLGDRQLQSKYNSLKHQQEVCFRQFPDGRSSGYLPEWPRTEETNAVFGGWNIKPTNVFWTGGQYDPWRTLSPLSDQDFSPKWFQNHTVPTCGTRKPDSYESLFAYLLPNSGHAYDFRSGWNESIPARNLWGSALDNWLKCYTKWNPFMGNLTAENPHPTALTTMTPTTIARLRRRSILPTNPQSIQNEDLSSEDGFGTSYMEEPDYSIPEWDTAHEANEWWISLDGAEDLPLGVEGIDEDEQMRRELARVKKSWAKVDAELEKGQRKRDAKVVEQRQRNARVIEERMRTLHKARGVGRKRFEGGAGAKKVLREMQKLDNVPMELVY